MKRTLRARLGGGFSGGLLILLLALTACHEDAPTEVVVPPPAPEPKPVLMHGLLEGTQHLKRTFAQLRKLEKGEPGRVAILHFGASHTASMAFADEVNTRLAARFGTLGPGYVPAAPMRATFLGAPTPPDSERGRIRVRQTGPWEIQNALHAPAGQIWSLAGSRLRGTNGAQLALTFNPPEDDEEPLSGAGRLEIHYLEEPGMARTTVRIDGEERPTLRPVRAASSTPLVRTARFDVVEAPRSVELAVSGPGRATLLGISYERVSSGIVYDVLGLSGSSAFVTDRYHRPSFLRQLKAREPSLYILFFGTNEAMFTGLTAENYRRRYTSLLKTLRQAAPRSECLLLSNTDREVPTDGGWEQAPHSETVERTIREVSISAKCAYWSARNAMGGKGGVQKWLEKDPPLALPDRTHLTETGYRTLAQMLLADLLAAYQHTVLPPPR